jgi:hypothetical protein
MGQEIYFHILLAVDNIIPTAERSACDEENLYIENSR